MKQLSMLFAIFIIASHARGQLSKNEIMLGGAVNLSSSKVKGNGYNDLNSYAVSILPQIGLGIGNNFTVGGLIGYQNSKKSTLIALGLPITTKEEKVNLYLLGAFARKHHPLKNWLGIFGQIDVSAGVGKLDDIERRSQPGGFNLDVHKKYSLRQYNALVRPGIYFIPTKRIIIEAIFGEFGYNAIIRTEVGPDDPEFRGSGAKYSDSRMRFSITNSLTVAVQYKLK